MNSEFMHTSHSIIYYTQCVKAHCEKAGIININYSFSYPHRMLKSILLRMARLYCYDNTTVIAASTSHSALRTRLFGVTRRELVYMAQPIPRYPNGFLCTLVLRIDIRVATL